MNVKTQKEAVFAAMCSVFGMTSFEEKVTPTKEQRGQVNNILFEGFKKGHIQYDGTIPEDSKLKSYVSGLQSNWLRKDKRLNGGVVHQPTNPGSRAGSTDPQVKAMRLLLATKSDPSARAEIQRFIDNRLATIKPTKSVELSAEQIALLEANGLGHLVES